MEGDTHAPVAIQDPANLDHIMKGLPTMSTTMVAKDVDNQLTSQSDRSKIGL